MRIQYYFEYEANNKSQKPERGTIEINEKEFKIINTACICRGITIKNLIEKMIETLTAEKAEKIICKWIDPK